MAWCLDVGEQFFSATPNPTRHWTAGPAMQQAKPQTFRDYAATRPSNHCTQGFLASQYHSVDEADVSQSSSYIYRDCCSVSDKATKPRMVRGVPLVTPYTSH